MYDTAAEILNAAKAEILPYDATFMDIAGSGHPRARHLPHGRRPEAQSALNGFCQMHDVKNVFVVDGSAFTTAAKKIPR